MDAIQQAYFDHVDGIIINPAAYTHTSVALLDAVKAVGIPTVEVHVSDPDSREEFRRVSYIRAACAATIRGHGLQGYVEALRFLCGMRQCMDADNLHRRLKKIIGQVQAIDRMVDEDVPCEDVLSQINAAKSALHKCGQVVLEGHIQHCVRDGIQHGDADKTIESFTKAVERFSNMG